MTSEDVTLQQDGSWVGIPLTSTYTTIHNGYAGSIFIRFGLSSTSKGMKVDTGETVMVDETVYVKPLIKTSNVNLSIVVTR